MSDEAVCRTAPATPGLLIIYITLMFYNSLWLFTLCQKGQNLLNHPSSFRNCLTTPPRPEWRTSYVNSPLRKCCLYIRPQDLIYVTYLRGGDIGEAMNGGGFQELSQDLHGGAKEQ